MNGDNDDNAVTTTTSFVRRGRRFRDASTAKSTTKSTPTDSEKVREADVVTRSGARGGLYGRILVSSGSADVDALTGGGLPLGSATCAGGDGCTTRGETLFGRYFLAEGVARGHRLCWARASSGRRRVGDDDSDVDDLRAFIPRRIEGKTTGGGGDDDQDAEDDGARKADDDGLRIAWQYRRYLKEGRALDDSRVGTSQFIRGGGSGGDGGSEATDATKKTRKKSLRAPDMCASYDLTREEDASRLEGVDLTAARFWNDDEDDGEVDSWARCYVFIRDFIRETSAKGDATIGRVLVQPETPTDTAEWAECASFVSALKSLVYGTNVVLMLVLPMVDAPERVGALIRHSVDCAIDVQPLEGPTSEIESLLPEPQTCVGLVAVRKLQFQGAVVSPLSRMDRVYALQVRRKRMAIKPLQIRPEEEASKKDTQSVCGTATAAGLDDF